MHSFPLFSSPSFIFETTKIHPKKNKMKVAMLGSILRRSSSSSPFLLRRAYSSESAPERKVAVLGAAGGIGQPLALLMKLNPLVSNLSLYDIAGTPGVAADVSHINTRSQVLYINPNPWPQPEFSFYGFSSF